MVVPFVDAEVDFGARNSSGRLLENWIAKVMTPERAKSSLLLRDFYRACRAVCGVDERRSSENGYCVGETT